MIKIDESMRQALAKYVGPDGKLIIDESLPEDIKESFRYFNEEGINVLEFDKNSELRIGDIGSEDEVDVTEDQITLSPEDYDDSEEDDDEEDAGGVEGVPIPGINPVQPVTPVPLSAEKQAEVNQSINDLNDMFGD